jgi:hypothetical protein
MEGKEVMLAQRLERDATGENQLVVALVVGERGEVERGRAEQFDVGVGDSPRRVGQVYVGRVAAEGDEQVGDGTGRRLPVRLPPVLDHPQAPRHGTGVDTHSRVQKRHLSSF